MPAAASQSCAASGQLLSPFVPFAEFDYSTKAI